MPILTLKLHTPTSPMFSHTQVAFRCVYGARDTSHVYPAMRWLWLVGSMKSQISFVKEPYKRDNILQQRPILLSILLSVATPYCCMACYRISTHTYIPHILSHPCCTGTLHTGTCTLYRYIVYSLPHLEWIHTYILYSLAHLESTLVSRWRCSRHTALSL